MSEAFRELSARLDEARLLSAQDPVRGGDTSKIALTNAVNRGALVLVCGHLEGYLEDLAVEVIDVLIQTGVDVDRLPRILRALHAEQHLTTLEPMRDRNARAPRIETLFQSEGELWRKGVALRVGFLDAATVASQMGNPGSKEIEQFLELLGVADLFDQLDLSGLSHLRSHVNELVAKRNAVAHGEVAATATAADVDRYIRAVEDLAAEVDDLVAVSVQEICQLATRPWAV